MKPVAIGADDAAFELNGKIVHRLKSKGVLVHLSPVGVEHIYLTGNCICNANDGCSRVISALKMRDHHNKIKKEEKTVSKQTSRICLTLTLLSLTAFTLINVQAKEIVIGMSSPAADHGWLGAVITNA